MKYETIISLADVHRSRRAFLNGLLISYFSLLVIITAVNSYNFWMVAPQRVSQLVIGQEFVPKFRDFESVVWQAARQNQIQKVYTTITVDGRDIRRNRTSSVGETEFDRIVEILIEYDSRNPYDDRIPIEIRSIGQSEVDVREFQNEIIMNSGESFAYAFSDFANRHARIEPVQSLEITMFGLNFAGNKLPFMLLALGIFIALHGKLHADKSKELLGVSEANRDHFDPLTISLFQKRSIIEILENRWYNPENKIFSIALIFLTIISTIPQIFNTNPGLSRGEGLLTINLWYIFLPASTLLSFWVVRRTWRRRRDFEPFF